MHPIQHAPLLSPQPTPPAPDSVVFHSTARAGRAFWLIAYASFASQAALWTWVGFTHSALAVAFACVVGVACVVAGYLAWKRGRRKYDRRFAAQQFNEGLLVFKNAIVVRFVRAFSTQDVTIETVHLHKAALESSWHWPTCRPRPSLRIRFLVPAASTTMDIIVPQADLVEPIETVIRCIHSMQSLA